MQLNCLIFLMPNLSKNASKLTRGFASDNQAGVLPQVMQALTEANHSHAPAYGYDPWTLDLQQYIETCFGPQTRVYPVYNGTGANVLALQAILRPFQSVLCAKNAHINEDECGAPERFLGIKLQTVDCPNGKLTPQDIENHLHYRGDEHRVQLKAVSITQPTEWGTLYSKEEIQALAHTCHQNGLWLHMDGARISNAAVALGLSFEAFTVQAGVDVLSLGGTKNGIMFGELLLVFNTELNSEILFFRKQLTQLHSKMRFISAQFLPWLQMEWWKEPAAHANLMAQLLAKGASQFPEVQLAQKTQVNGVFAYIPKEWNTPLMQHMPFYIFQPATNMARWMCAFDSQKEDIHRFLEQMKQLSKASDVFLEL